MAAMPPGGGSKSATPRGAEAEFDSIVAELERRARIAIPVCVALGALFAWWALNDGAYFGSVFYPPAMGVFALCILLALMAPFTGSISGPMRLGVAGLGGLAAWTLLSAFWSATPSTAVEDALRVFLYLGVFVAGFWTVHLLGRRMLLALAPVAAAGAIVAVAATFVLLTGDDYQAYLHPDSTLRLPIGYRNANAAFFLICCWPLLVLAAQSALRWELRVLSVGRDDGSPRPRRPLPEPRLTAGGRVRAACLRRLLPQSAPRRRRGRARDPARPLRPAGPPRCLPARGGGCRVDRFIARCGPSHGALGALLDDPRHARPPRRRPQPQPGTRPGPADLTGGGRPQRRGRDRRSRGVRRRARRARRVRRPARQRVRARGGP